MMERVVACKTVPFICLFVLVCFQLVPDDRRHTVFQYECTVNSANSSRAVRKNSMFSAVHKSPRKVAPRYFIFDGPFLTPVWSTSARDG